MSAWNTKKFWSDVTVAAHKTGFVIQLDGRAIKTPAKKLLALPTERLAQAIAEEWNAQGDKVRPDTMPLTRLSNTATDLLAVKRTDVIAEMVRYGMNDLLCYRADWPQKLVAAQVAQWDPLLDWAHDIYGVDLVVTTGLMPVDQTDDTGKTYEALLAQKTDFALTGLSEMTAISGSLVIALAAGSHFKSPEELFEIACIDERVQAQDWGEDDEASATMEAKRSAFLAASQLLHLSAAA